MVQAFRKYGFYILYAAILLLPPALNLLGIPESKPLLGAYKPVERPSPDFATYYSGAFQKKTDEYLAWNISLKPLLVRTRSQLFYSLLDKPALRFVVKGREEYLFEDAYIKAHYGMDFKGSEHWASITSKLSAISQKLRERGIPLIVVLAPGKGSYCQDYIPSRYWQFRKDSTNYQALQGRLQSAGIDLIDMHAWFRHLRDKRFEANHFPLFPKTGTHWSTYGMHLAADSILRYLEQRMGKKLPQWHITLREPTLVLQDQDSDIEESLNLWRTIPNFPMQYPILSIRDSLCYRPKGAVIADSYFWNMFNYGFCSRAMDEGEFWYYAAQVYPQTFEAEHTLDAEHIRSKLPDLDFLIMLGTDGTMDRFPWGADTLFSAALQIR